MKLSVGLRDFVAYNVTVYSKFIVAVRRGWKEENMDGIKRELNVTELKKRFVFYCAIKAEREDERANFS